ncbi:hypothetical protein BGX29_010480 [Mortierella sp. GBA35]|nr:hypothetical protein BGX23_005041 [Mortierella sp. AD031]KAF9092394.1 hypothetical protein BGX29_010480 [Mortierella sp. GBA35]
MSTSASHKRLEVDGSCLHSALAKIAGNRYRYDQHLTEEESRRHEVRDIFGKFACHVCRPSNPRIWYSGVICTELYLSHDNRYRALLHSQKCKRCNQYAEPEVDEERYAQKVKSALDLWTGERERIEPDPDHVRHTGPHDSRRCHGCEKGVCTRSDKHPSRRKLF